VIGHVHRLGGTWVWASRGGAYHNTTTAITATRATTI
jgi:hypothetical protein